MFEELVSLILFVLVWIEKFNQYLMCAGFPQDVGLNPGQLLLIHVLVSFHCSTSKLWSVLYISTFCLTVYGRCAGGGGSGWGGVYMTPITPVRTFLWWNTSSINRFCCHVHIVGDGGGPWPLTTDQSHSAHHVCGWISLLTMTWM